MTWVWLMAALSCGMLLGWLVGRRGEHRSRDVLAKLGDGVILLNAAGNVVWGNERAGLFLGLRDHSSPDRLQLALARIPDLRAHVDGFIAGDDDPEELIVQAGYPQVRHLRVQVARLTSGEVLITMSDITRMKRLEEVRRRFAADLSHQLRTPVTSIRLLAEMLGEREDQSETEAVLRIHRETQRLEELVNEIMMLSRLEAGEVDLKIECFPVCQVVQEAVEPLIPQMQRADLRLATEVEEAEWSGDFSRLVHAVSIYLDNAVRFSPRGGTISVRAQTDARGHVLTVTDEGPGIPEDELPLVFRSFFRGRRGIQGDGTGLGLAIAKHIVATHGGEVFVDSAVSRGSTFGGFILPMSGPPASW